MCVCVIKLIGWKMDGWIGLSGCGCGKWKVESGKWRGSGSHIFIVAKYRAGTYDRISALSSVDSVLNICKLNVPSVAYLGRCCRSNELAAGADDDLSQKQIKRRRRENRGAESDEG